MEVRGELEGVDSFLLLLRTGAKLGFSGLVEDASQAVSPALNKYLLGTLFKGQAQFLALGLHKRIQTSSFQGSGKILYWCCAQA